MRFNHAIMIIIVMGKNCIINNGKSEMLKAMEEDANEENRN